MLAPFGGATANNDRGRREQRWLNSAAGQPQTLPWTPEWKQWRQVGILGT
jgi:hypothetical protein